jgi:hypothetical protein
MIVLRWWRVWYDMALYYTPYCGVLYCGVLWCGVVWCGVVWPGVLYRAYMFLIEFLETVATETQSMQKVCTHAYIGNRI